MMNTTNALIRLWLNAAFLPIAFTIDMINSATPADDAESGAPEGASVIELAERRKKVERQ